LSLVKEIIGIDIKESIDALRRLLIETKLSRIVVFEGNIDHIIGYVHQLDMFKRPGNYSICFITYSRSTGKYECH
jgi:CBS domain containing-hemolysin-like protein